MTRNRGRRFPAFSLARSKIQLVSPPPHIARGDQELSRDNSGFVSAYYYDSEGRHWIAKTDSAYNADVTFSLAIWNQSNPNPEGFRVAFDDFFLDSSWVPPSDGNGGGQTPVPEPATMLLLGAGLIGLAGYGRKWLNRQHK
jgi:hypothetical protein